MWHTTGACVPGARRPEKCSPQIEVVPGGSIPCCGDVRVRLRGGQGERQGPGDRAIKRARDRQSQKELHKGKGQKKRNTLTK